MKTHDQFGPLRDVDIPFLALESTQRHSHDLQTAHTDFTFKFFISRCILTLKNVTAVETVCSYSL